MARSVAPGGLVQFGRDGGRVFSQVPERISLRGQPVGVGVAGGEAVFGVMAPVKDAIAIIFWAGLFATACACEVELSAETAVVAVFG